MLTLKLYARVEYTTGEAGPDGSRSETFSQNETRIVEADDIVIRELRRDALFEIDVIGRDGHSRQSFYVCPHGKHPDCIAVEAPHRFYYAAYVENAQGKTSEVVKFN